MLLRSSVPALLTSLVCAAVACAQSTTPYVPEPQPARSEYLVGSHYFPGWKEGQHFVPWPGEDKAWGWYKIEPYPNRTPLLGYYDEGSPEVADWEIKWALEHGISYFVYCWYRQRDNVGQPLSEQTLRLGHAIHEGLFHARYRDRFHFAIMWENNNGGGVSSLDDLFRNLVPFWIENYFRQPSYLKIDGKPVLYIYHLGRLLKDLDGPEQTRDAMTRLRAAVVAAGFPGLVLLCRCPSSDTAPFAEIRDLGFDATFSYGWRPPQQRPTAQEAVTYQLESLQAWHRQQILPFASIVSMGWDPLPWNRDHPSTPRLLPSKMSRWMLSPEQFQTVLAQAKTMMDRQPADSLSRRLLLLDNWNEWGEGHYIAPHAGAGFGYLKAVREVFTACDNHPDYRSPFELGLGPYDSRHRARWSQEPKPSPADAR